MRAATAWRDLQDALAINTPLCEGDERFTAETGEHDAVLRTICAACPIQSRCADYARAARHNGGVWGFYGGLARRSQPQVRDRRRASVNARG